MQKLTHLLIGLWTCSITILNAQQVAVLESEGLNIDHYKESISLTYVGESYSHPGFALAYNQSFKTWYKRKIKKNGKEKIKIFDIGWDNRFTFYHHERNHSGFVGAMGVDFSITKKKGGFLSIGLLTGGLYKYFNEDVYTVTASNEVEKVKNAGNLTFIYGLKTAFGKRIKIKKEPSRYALFISSMIFYATPFGTNQILHSLFEAGIKYNI